MISDEFKPALNQLNLLESITDDMWKNDFQTGYDKIPNDLKEHYKPGLIHGFNMGIKKWSLLKGSAFNEEDLNIIERTIAVFEHATSILNEMSFENQSD